MSFLKKHKTLLLALLVMALWGSLYPAAKLAYKAYDIVTPADIILFIGIRFTVCGALIFLFARTRKGGKENVAKAKSALPIILLSGVFAIILNYAFTNIGLSMTAGSKTAIIKQIGSLFYISLSFLFFKDDHPTKRKLIAALIGFLGIVALNIDGGGIVFRLGDILVLCASFCTMLGNVTSKKVFSRGIEPLVSTGISQFFGGIVMLAVGLLLGGRVSYSLDSSLLLMLYFFVASSVSYCLWYIILSRGALSNLFIIKFAEPLFSCLFSAMLLGENVFKWQYLAAFLLICSGILICSYKKHEKRSENQKA